MADLPLIGVMAERTQAGANSHEDEVPPLTVATLADCMETRWPTDAHFVCYQPKNNAGQDDWPRCNKPILPKLRLAGIDLVQTIIAIDYDNPGHAAWTSEGLDAFLSKLSDIAERWPMAMDWSLLYTTRRGARLVYVLDEPLPADRCETKNLWLCRKFTDMGLPMDARVDWTHIYRLPYVTRDGKKTWEDAMGVVYLPQWDRRLKIKTVPDSLPGPSVAQTYTETPEYKAPKPSEDTSSKLLEIFSGNGRMVATEWAKEAKRRLKGRDCYGCLFEHKDIAPVGMRDVAIHSYVGQATSLLYNAPGTTPEHVYALFLPAVQQLQPDRDTPDWTAVLWSSVCRLWSREASKQKEVERKEALRAQVALTLQDTMLSGMKKWCGHLPIWKQPESEQKAWLSHHLLASMGTNWVLLQPDGTYESLQLTRNMVIPRIRAAAMEDLLPTWRMGREGNLMDRDFTEIINAHSTTVASVRAIPNISGGRIERVDTQTAVLTIPAYKRDDDLAPAFNNDVDIWLRKMFGGYYAAATEWIQWALAFEEGPICALSIAGPPGIGKKLFVQGLAECLVVPRVADASDLCGTYQYGLIESPFLVVNEGWPRQHTGRHPSDQFRALIGGDPMVINRRYMHPVVMTNPVRIILTANNYDVIRLLMGNRDMSPDDRDAINSRLLHMDLGAEAADWLRLKGGTFFTGAHGSRWIAGDGGQESDRLVARHFLWLYSQKAARPPGRRFLVEGGNSADVLFELRTQAGTAPLVIESLLKLLSMTNLPEGITVDEGRLFVLVSEVLNYSRNNNKNNEKLTAGSVSSALRGLCTATSPKTASVVHSRRRLGYKRWYEIDTKLLLTVARRDGWHCPMLDKLVRDSSSIEGKETLSETAEGTEVEQEI